jgi:hypothetical protein
LSFSASPNVRLVTYSFSVGDRIVETGDYDKLIHKPSYNGVVWEGNKTFEDVGDFNLTNIQFQIILNDLIQFK